MSCAKTEYRLEVTYTNGDVDTLTYKGVYPPSLAESYLFEFDTEEKYRIKQQFKEALQDFGHAENDTMLDALIAKLPNLPQDN
jgi:hypothetical protein